MTSAATRRNPFDRFWVLCLLFLVVVLVGGAAFSWRELPYWGQPRTDVTVTDVLYRDGPRGPESDRCRFGSSALEVTGDDGRTGVLYECGTQSFQGDRVSVVWHESEDRVRAVVMSPLLTAAVLGGIYVVLVGVAGAVVLAQRRRERLSGTDPSPETPDVSRGQGTSTR